MQISYDFLLPATISLPKMTRDESELKDEPDDPKLVNLNVGGHYFTTSLQTLIKYPGRFQFVAFLK